MEFRVLTKTMSLYPYQDLYFTTLEYEALKPVFSSEKPNMSLDSIQQQNVLLLTGIASPKQMMLDLQPYN